MFQPRKTTIHSERTSMPELPDVWVSIVEKASERPSQGQDRSSQFVSYITCRRLDMSNTTKYLFATVLRDGCSADLDLGRHAFR